MADLEVNIPSLKSTRGSVKDSVESLDKMLREMYESVRELNSTWEGPNHEEFTEKFERNHENMEELNRSLETYVKTLKKAESLYGKCEEEVWQIVRAQ